MILLLLQIAVYFIANIVGFKIGGDTFWAGWFSLLVAQIVCTILQAIDKA